MIEAFNLGPFLIPIHPLILVLSVFFAIWFSNWLGGKYMLDKNRVKHAAEYTAWTGLLGARLGFVVLNWSAYRAAPWTALYVWQPGYLYSSGVLVGAIYALWQVIKISPNLRRSFLTVLAGSYLALARSGIKKYSPFDTSHNQQALLYGFPWISHNLQVSCM